jgi:hypothetical protein
MCSSRHRDEQFIPAFNMPAPGSRVLFPCVQGSNCAALKQRFTLLLAAHLLSVSPGKYRRCTINRPLQSLSHQSHSITINFLLDVWLEVLTAVTMKMAVFWVVVPCRLVWVYRRFRGLYCLHHQDDHPRRQPTSYLLDATLLFFIFSKCELMRCEQQQCFWSFEFLN